MHFSLSAPLRISLLTYLQRYSLDLPATDASNSSNVYIIFGTRAICQCNWAYFQQTVIISGHLQFSIWLHLGKLIGDKYNYDRTVFWHISCTYHLSKRAWLKSLRNTYLVIFSVIFSSVENVLFWAWCWHVHIVYLLSQPSPSPNLLGWGHMLWRRLFLRGR